ncbi:phage terminase small subunit P27 family [Orbus wheelerorum]|uniref:phage terminase small subunit P27 family n=1 Tax=Orbus wheelerorum TaxID=3074111 RepID=UPI00370D5B7F
MPGPAKTPTHINNLKGNPGKRGKNKNEPQPKKAIPNAPRHLKKLPKYWFNVIADELDCIGVLTKIDGKALELLVEAYAEYRHHCGVLDKEDYTYRTSEGLIKAHPAAAMKADAWKRIKTMLAEFGMTPSSRSKVSVTNKDEFDPLEEFLKGRK